MIDPFRRTRAFGILMLAGGALAVITVLLPPAAVGSDPAVLAIGLLAAAIGVALLLAPRELPELALAPVAALGTVLITVATYEGGFDGTGTADNQMLYVWVCFLCFFFFNLRQALVQLAIVGAAYGLLLASQDVAAGDAATRWTVTMAVLLTGGMLVARLRRANDVLLVKLRERARLDPLTGLLNRAALAERAATEFARARRGAGPVAILVADLDDLKSVNDTFGHPVGDGILLRVAAIFTDGTREVDAVARTGGDEFVVLLPGTTAVAARLTAERLRADVQRASSVPELRSTISVGVAVGPPDGKSLDDLWSAADRAMYLAKRGGGNAVATAGEIEGARPAALPEPALAGAYD